MEEMSARADAATGGGDREMEQLLGMGFSEEMSAQALAATGSNSAAEAVEWILTHQSQPLPSPLSSAPSTSRTLHRRRRSTPAMVQHSLEHYFGTKSPRKQQTHNPPPSISRRSRPPPPRRNSKRPKGTAAASESLAERMRPRTVDEVVGQDHILGPGTILRSALNRGLLPSLILWGPPGTGKTSIARALAAAYSSSHHFVSLCGSSASVKDVRDAVEEARTRRHLMNRTRTVLFMDEVHRFNRAQQDAFLPAIEDGTVVFLGATTENPSFHLTAPLLSRCRLLDVRPLQPHHIATLLRRSVEDNGRGVSACSGTLPPFLLEEDAADFLSLHCDGDARVALNALEVAATLALDRKNSTNTSTDIPEITLGDVKESMQRKLGGRQDRHLLGALDRSIRGRDADAALYWLARLLEAGEQPLRIACSLVRSASEDVGLAKPSALIQAVSCYQACHFVGMPECDVNLAQCVAYLARAPKSVEVYRALQAARRLVKESVGGNEGVPLHLRNAPTRMMKELGYGKGYLYPPDHPLGCSSQTYLPPSLVGLKLLDWPPSKDN